MNASYPILEYDPAAEAMIEPSRLNVRLFDSRMFGYFFTQLTDVFQEQNGIFTFERQPKFDLDGSGQYNSRQPPSRL